MSVVPLYLQPGTLPQLINPHTQLRLTLVTVVSARTSLSITHIITVLLQPGAETGEYERSEVRHHGVALTQVTSAGVAVTTLKMRNCALCCQFVRQGQIQIGQHLINIYISLHAAMLSTDLSTPPVNVVSLTATKVETSEVGEAPVRPE